MLTFNPINQVYMDAAAVTGKGATTTETCRLGWDWKRYLPFGCDENLWFGLCFTLDALSAAGLYFSADVFSHPDNLETLYKCILGRNLNLSIPGLTLISNFAYAQETQKLVALIDASRNGSTTCDFLQYFSIDKKIVGDYSDVSWEWVMRNLQRLATSGQKYLVEEIQED